MHTRSSYLFTFYVSEHSHIANCDHLFTFYIRLISLLFLCELMSVHLRTYSSIFVIYIFHALSHYFPGFGPTIHLIIPFYK